MVAPLYVEQEVVPFAETGKEVMIVFRDHGTTGAKPNVFVTALTSDAGATIASGKGANTDSYSSTTAITFNSVGQREAVEVPIGGDMTDTVSVVRVDSGRVAISVVSPQRVQTEFRTRKHP